MAQTKPLGFAALADTLELLDDGYRAHIPESWRQGRTAYGGLTSGLALVAAQSSFPDVPPLRSANINFIGPVSGEPVFKTMLLRAGRNVTTVKVEGYADDKIIADIVFTFGINRESLLSVDCTASQSPAPESCEPFTPKALENFVPKFFLRFDTRLIEGERPMSGAEGGYIRAWSRHTNIKSREGIASLLTLSDVLPPAALPMLTKMGPVSSVNFLLNFVTDIPQTKDGWWQVETKLTTANKGYSSQVMRIFDYEGRLVAEGIQMVALFV